jgi:hypothetical protein
MNSTQQINEYSNGVRQQKIDKAMWRLCTVAVGILVVVVNIIAALR